MKKFLISLFYCASLLTAHAQTTTPSSNHPDPLEPIAWMAGGTWHGEVVAAKGQPPTTIDTKVTRVLSGRALYFETAFNGLPTYAGSFAYDAARRAIVFAYPSAAGDWVSGTLVPKENFLLLDFTNTTPNGTVEHYQTRMHQDGPDDYTWTLYAPAKESWSPLFSVKYHRSKT